MARRRTYKASLPSFQRKLHPPTRGPGGSSQIRLPRFFVKELDGLFGLDLSLSSIIIPERRVASGILLSSTSHVWRKIVTKLKDDWTLAYSLPPQKWEELVAGAFDRAGFDEVILTPRSGDRGRDVIAIKNGFGCIKIIDSVKAYKPGHVVGYDDVRALLGVLSGERDASKGIITTTSAFPARLKDDPFIGPFIPTRLELMDGERLRAWLTDLQSKS